MGAKQEDNHGGRILLFSYVLYQTLTTQKIDFLYYLVGLFFLPSFQFSSSSLPLARKVFLFMMALKTSNQAQQKGKKVFYRKKLSYKAIIVHENSAFVFN